MGLHNGFDARRLRALKQLKAACDRVARTRLVRLVGSGYIVDRATGLELVQYRITQRCEYAPADVWGHAGLSAASAAA
jgi:hypothetical protein